MKKIISQNEINKQIIEINKFFKSETINEIAKQTCFVQRNTSRITGTVFLAVFTLGLNLYEKPSINQLLGLLKTFLPDIEMKRESFSERINTHAVNFFEFMLSQALSISVKNIDLKVLKNFKRVLILDSTSISLPEELELYFRGSGGSGSKSALKIQFCYDLKSEKFFYLIEDGICSDTKYENSFVDKLESDDLIIKDLGFFNIQAFIDMDKKGTYFLSRWKSNVEIFIKDETNNIVSLDMERYLSKIDYVTELEIYLKKGKEVIKSRLVIEKVPDNVKAERLRKVNQNSIKKGRQTKKLTKVFQGFNVYVSNAEENYLSKENFRKIYSFRWQIELIFKNWKSNFYLDKIEGWKKERVKCTIYARLLMIIISRKFISYLRAIVWIEKMEELSEFKASKHLIIVLQEVLKSLIKDEDNIAHIFKNSMNFILNHCLKVKEKGRVYPLQFLSSIS